MYVNYEILCNAMATKTIDLSQAETYLIKSTQIPRKEFEILLQNLNYYSIPSFYLRFEKIQ